MKLEVESCEVRSDEVRSPSRSSIIQYFMAILYYIYFLYFIKAQFYKETKGNLSTYPVAGTMIMEYVFLGRNVNLI